jgi:hypothetical protein
MVAKNPALFGQIMAHDASVTPEKIKALSPNRKDRDKIKTQMDDAQKKEKEALDNTKKSDTAPSNKTPATPALKPIA